jgi:photosystem II stability/assembly factor-like uncharacterized protein
VHGSWTSVPAPRFPAGRKLSEYAVSPRSPDNLFATDGTIVMRSTDGGCSWRKAYELTSAPSADAPIAGAARIESIYLPVNGRNVVVVISETIGPAVRPHVVVSDDGGKTWSLGDAGLPPAGTPVRLAGPADGRIAYLRIDVAGAIDAVYASTDGGHSWEPRGRLPAEASGGSDLDVDPIEPDRVWASGSGGLFRSADGGRTFTAVEEFSETRSGPVDVFHFPGMPARIVAFRPALRDLLRSADGGRTWLRHVAPGATSSVAHGVAADSLIGGSGGRVYAFVPSAASWVDLHAAAGATDVAAALTATPVFFARTPMTIEVYRGPIGRDLRIPPGTLVLPDVSLPDIPPPPNPPPATLSPRERTVRIAAGESRTVSYRLSLPRIHTPLDLYLLTDSSSSFKPFIEGLRRGAARIVSALVSERIDLRFGLAEYRDYPDRETEPAAEREPNFVYRQTQDLTSDSASLERALESIRAAGGGYYNAMLGALFQTATGAGQEVFPPGPENDVPPGLQADYRREALKVVILVADDRFIEERDAYPRDLIKPNIPSFDEVAAALDAKGIHQVGLSLSYDASPYLRRMASATEAFAPARGIDCDGNGERDLTRDDPLVCDLDRTSLARGDAIVPAIVNLVQGVRTRAAVNFRADADKDVISKVDPQGYESVVLQSSNVLTFDVTYRCPRVLAGDRAGVTLRASGTDVSELAHALVVCGEVPAEDDPPPPSALERALGTLPLVPAAPTSPIPEPASQTQGQGQAQAQAQAQGQAAVAAQEQEQPQVASAYAYRAALEESAREEYALARLRTEPEPPFPRVATGAAVLTLACGLALTGRRLGVARAGRRV